MSLRRAASKLLPAILKSASESSRAQSLIPSAAALSHAWRIEASPALIRTFKTAIPTCSSVAEVLRNEIEYERQNYVQPEVGLLF